jgi:hypothetical protein
MNNAHENEHQKNNILPPEASSVTVSLATPTKGGQTPQDDDLAKTMETGCEDRPPTALDIAVVKGDLSDCKKAREDGSPWSEFVCFAAASRGRLDILEWARENGCPWDEKTCSGAAAAGHLDILKWARKNGCPWDEYVCIYASLANNVAVLEWARENGCPWDGERPMTTPSTEALKKQCAFMNVSNGGPTPLDLGHNQKTSWVLNLTAEQLRWIRENWGEEAAKAVETGGNPFRGEGTYREPAGIGCVERFFRNLRCDDLNDNGGNLLFPFCIEDESYKADVDSPVVVEVEYVELKDGIESEKKTKLLCVSRPGQTNYIFDHFNPTMVPFDTKEQITVKDVDRFREMGSVEVKIGGVDNRQHIRVSSIKTVIGGGNGVYDYQYADQGSLFATEEDAIKVKNDYVQQVWYDVSGSDLFGSFATAFHQHAYVTLTEEDGREGSVGSCFWRHNKKLITFGEDDKKQFAKLLTSHTHNLQCEDYPDIPSSQFSDWHGFICFFMDENVFSYFDWLFNEHTHLEQRVDGQWMYLWTDRQTGTEYDVLFEDVSKYRGPLEDFNSTTERVQGIFEAEAKRLMTKLSNGTLELPYQGSTESTLKELTA